MKINPFWRGVITYGAVTSLIQDSMGKEEYLRRVETGWIDASITVPIALLALLYVFIWGGENG
jgi:hypothetical protein